MLRGCLHANVSIEFKAQLRLTKYRALFEGEREISQLKRKVMHFTADMTSVQFVWHSSLFDGFLPM